MFLSLGPTRYNDVKTFYGDDWGLCSKVLTESVGIGESLQSAWALAECVGTVE